MPFRRVAQFVLARARSFHISFLLRRYSSLEYASLWSPVSPAHHIRAFGAVRMCVFVWTVDVVALSLQIVCARHTIINNLRKQRHESHQDFLALSWNLRERRPLAIRWQKIEFKLNTKRGRMKNKKKSQKKINKKNYWMRHDSIPCHAPQFSSLSELNLRCVRNKIMVLVGNKHVPLALPSPHRHIFH